MRAQRREWPFGGTVPIAGQPPISQAPYLRARPGLRADPLRWSHQEARERRSPSGLDNLYRAGDLDPQAVSNFYSSPHRIKREIHGKHYIQVGGKAGFRYFKSNVMAEQNDLHETR